MLSINSSASRAIVPVACRLRYCSICTSPHVMCPLLLAGLVVLMPTVGSVLHSPCSMANAIRWRSVFSQPFCEVGGLPAIASVMFLRWMVARRFSP